jgi:sulfur-oxidizing protein SoxY
MDSDFLPPRDRLRRGVLARLGGLAGAMMAATAGLLSPVLAWAGTRNVEAFDAKAIDLALVAAGVADAVESEDVILRAPDIAENSAIVHVEIQSKVPDTRSILLFAEKNPQPLVAQFDLLPGLEPVVSVRIKMAESAHLRAVVLAGDRKYFARRETKVTLGGCAG